MKRSLVIFLIISFISGCHERRDMGEMVVTNPPSSKKQYKTHDQFIQIAYIDLFNKTIDPKRLAGIKQTFDSQGDDDINYKLFVKELLGEAKTQLPSDATLKKDPSKFIKQSYIRFLGRYPNEYESKIFLDHIDKDASVSVSKIYYILMTSQEYRMF